MKAFQAFVFASLLTSLAINAHSQLYWTGFSENWHDAASWANCPACPPGAGIPDENTTVVFQESGSVNIGTEAHCRDFVVSENVSVHFTGGELEIYGYASIGEQALIECQALLFKGAQNALSSLAPIYADISVEDGATLQLNSNLVLPENELKISFGALDASGFGLALKRFICLNSHNALNLTGSKIVVSHVADVHPAVQAEESEASIWPEEGADVNPGPLTVSWNRDSTCGTGAGQTPFTISASVASDYNGEDISCNGADDGIATVSVDGGIGPFSFQWVGGTLPVFTQNYNGLGAGTYTVLVTDLGQGITCVDNVQLTEPAPIAVFDFISTPPSCSGECDGSATSITIGGVAPYSYLWGNGETTQSATALCEGPVTLTITDSNDCVFTTSYTVELDELVADLQVIDVLCNGDDSGSASVNPSGGDGGPYTVSWSNGASGNTVNGLGAGSYSVTVTDGGGCELSIDFEVAEAPAIVVSIDNTTEPECNGDATGSIEVSATGGDEPYDFAWTGPNGFNGNGATIDNLEAGEYTLTLTDANGCEATANVSLIEPDAIDIQGVINNIDCHGDETGSIELSITGGTPDYLIEWSGPDGFASTAQNINNLAEGSYSVSVTDASDCLAIENFEVIAPDPIDPDATTVELSCNNGNDGAISLNLSGGTPGYVVTWSGPDGYNANGTFISGLSAGSYDALVTDAEGCEANFLFELSEPDPLDIAIDVTPVSCNGFDDGSAEASVDGGTAPYDFAWTGPNGFVSNDPILTDLEPGLYTLTITDAEGCAQDANALISEPDPIVLVEDITDVSCGGNEDGAIDLSVLGGTPPYVFSWTGPDGFAANTEDISNLPAGSYQITVTDLEDCTANAEYEVTEVPELMLTLTPTDVTCNGEDDGAVSLEINGGQGPFEVNWAGPNLFISNDQNINNLEPGFYNVLVIDANGCFAEDAAIVEEPEVMVVDLSATDPTCFGESDGSILAEVSGGTLPYSYLWSNGETDSLAIGLPAGSYTVDVTDDSGCVVNAGPVELNTADEIQAIIDTTGLECGVPETGSIAVTVSGGVPDYAIIWTGPDGFSSDAFDLNNLNEGNYFATISDAENCTLEISASISNPDPLTVDGTVSPLLCADDLADIVLTITGGSPDYNIVWVGPNGFTSSDQNLNDLSQGVYEVQVTDGEGCTATESFDATVPDPLLVSGDVQALDCTGDPIGAIDLTITGGTEPYTINWTGSGFNSNDEDIFNLGPGIYTVLVEDANGCSNTTAFNLSEPDVLQIDVTSADPSCNDIADGSIEVTVDGGVAPYNLEWTGPNGFFSSDALIESLEPGSYTLDVSDNGNCTESIVVTLTAPDPIAIDATVTDIECSGENSGSISLNITGGTPSYDLVWSGPDAFSSTNASITSLAPGSYLAEVQDMNACLASATFMIFEADAILVDLSTGDSSCGENNGTASVTASGGTGALDIVWLDSGGTIIGNGNDLENLTSGAYALNVSDEAGCEVNLDFNISDSDAVELDASPTNPLCGGSSNGSIDLEITGGVGVLEIAWTGPDGFSSSEEDISDLAEGIYTVSVSDEDGCFSAITVELTAPEALSVQLDVNPVSCDATDDGSILSSVSGGMAPYTFDWTGPGGFTADTQDILNLETGEYIILVTDANFCSTESSVTLTQAQALDISFTVTDAGCNGNNGGSIEAEVVSAVEPLVVTWTGPNGFSSADLEIENLIAGNYNVTVEDATGCSLQASFDVNESDEIELQVEESQPACQSDDGELTATATGGNGSFSYFWYDLDNGNTLIGTEENLTGLVAGNYFIEVFDDLGCTASQTIALSENAGELTAALTSPLCFGDSNGSIDLSVDGSNPPYTFTWSGPNGFTSFDEDISDLESGTYDVEVIDALGCTLIETFDLAAPEQLTAGINVTDISCFGAANGELELYTTGGSAPVTIEWTDDNGFVSDEVVIEGLEPGCFDVLVTDANLCQVSSAECVSTPEEIVIDAEITDVFCNGGDEGSISLNVSGGYTPYTYLWVGPDAFTADTPLIENLPPGVYELQLTDGNLCVVNETFEVVETNGVEADVLAINPQCAEAENGSIELFVTNGQAPFSIVWYADGEEIANGTFVGNLVAGEYSYTITDDLGCVLEESVTLEEPQALQMVIDVIGISCHNADDGSMTATFDGGTAPYNLAWTGPNGFSSIEEVITDLGPGSYELVATDANGCSLIEGADLLNPTPVTLEFVNIQQASCLTSDDGSIEVLASGGTPEYQFEWSGPDGFTSDTALVEGLFAGNYSVVVTDASGCSQLISSVPLPYSGDISVDAGDDATTCFDSFFAVKGENTGENEGAWYDLNGQLIAEGDSLTLDFLPGEYTLVYTANDNACVQHDSIDVEIFELPPADAGLDREIYPEDQSIIGGSPTSNEDNLIVWEPAEFLVDEDQTNPTTIPLLQSTQYFLEVTDLNGCSSRDSVWVYIIPELEVPSGFTPNGDGMNDLWMLGNTDLYPSIVVEIYNRWGEMLYRDDRGYGRPWDGTYNGNPVPVGTYYYVIDIDEPKFKASLNGPVTILR